METALKRCLRCRLRSTGGRRLRQKTGCQLRFNRCFSRSLPTALCSALPFVHLLPVSIRPSIVHSSTQATNLPSSGRLRL